MGAFLPGVRSSQRWPLGLLALLRLRAIRPRQHFDRMQDLGGEPMLRYSLAQLQNAARVTCENELRFQRSQVPHFTVEQGLCCVAMEEVVNPSAATTPVTFGDFEQCERWDLVQQEAGLIADLLAVQEVTGIVVGYAQWHRVERLS